MNASAGIENYRMKEMPTKIGALKKKGCHMTITGIGIEALSKRVHLGHQLSSEERETVQRYINLKRKAMAIYKTGDSFKRNYAQNHIKLAENMLKIG